MDVALSPDTLEAGGTAMNELKTVEMLKPWKHRLGSGLLLAFSALAVGCAPGPHIENVTVTPSSYAVSGFVNSAPFSLTADIVDFTDPVTSATASIEGTTLTYDLVKMQTIASGERWGISTTLLLWQGLSSGTYYIDVTAKDNGGKSVGQTRAATVVVSN